MENDVSSPRGNCKEGWGKEVRKRAIIAGTAKIIGVSHVYSTAFHTKEETYRWYHRLKNSESSVLFISIQIRATIFLQLVKVSFIHVKYKDFSSSSSSPHVDTFSERALENLLLEFPFSRSNLYL